MDGRSVGRKLSALRHLYRYLLLDKKIEHDPTLNIDSPKQWKVLPKSLARDEMETTLEAPNRSSHAQGHSMPKRWQIEIGPCSKMLYAGALRVSEMVGAKLEDLKLDAATC